MTDEIYIDLTAPDPSLRPGVDLWQVDKAEKKESKSSGQPMIELTLSRVSASAEKITDRVMLAGNGYDMGRSKLGAFLQPGFKGGLNLASIKNVRVWANTEVTSFNGRSKLEVKPKDGFPNGGFAPWTEGGTPPPGYTAPLADATPF